MSNNQQPPAGEPALDHSLWQSLEPDVENTWEYLAGRIRSLWWRFVPRGWEIRRLFHDMYEVVPAPVDVEPWAELALGPPDKQSRFFPYWSPTRDTPEEMWGDVANGEPGPVLQDIPEGYRLWLPKQGDRIPSVYQYRRSHGWLHWWPAVWSLVEDSPRAGLVLEGCEWIQWTKYDLCVPLTFATEPLN